MKLCPICDHELTGGNYCPVCRKIVTKPWIIADEIFINKCHFGNDLICEFEEDDRRMYYTNGRHLKEEKKSSYRKPEPYDQTKNSRYKMTHAEAERTHCLINGKEV